MKRVVFIGTKDEPLVEALRHSCDSLRVITSSQRLNKMILEKSFCDLVVTRTFNLNFIKNGLALLKSGGYLYWEINRKNIFKGLRKKFLGKVPDVENGFSSLYRSVLSFRYFSNHLEKEGLQNIQIYWHHPDFETCKELIPLINPLALHYIILGRCNKTHRDRKYLVGKILLKLNLLNWFVPTFSIIAHKI